jgi:tetratricopeptide (TPR) repeat protein
MDPTGDVRRQLERVVQSGAFRTAESLRTLLAFVVDETLAGRADNLKESLLGAIALRKGPSFDPKVDPIVRVQMGRLRQRLRQYYATEGRRDTIVIGLSKGTYTPAIRERAPLADDDHELVNPQRHEWSRFTADELHLKARYLLGQRNVTSVREAAILVEEVLQKSPCFAAAYVTLAECYRIFMVLEMMPPADVVPKIRTACEQALRLEATSAEAHAALAGVLAWSWNFAAAEREYELAIAYGPQNAFAYQRYAIHLAATGRFAGAIDCARHACELDPLSAAGEHIRGVVQYWTRDFAEALECAHRAVALAPRFALGHHLLGFVCLHTHDYGQAIDALARATSLSGASTFDLGYQAYGFGVVGEQAKAREILAQLTAAAQREYVAPLSIAHCFLGLGMFDEALTWIERAYVPARSQWPYYLAAPFYEPLFRDERFQAIVERIGLPRP